MKIKFHCSLRITVGGLLARECSRNCEKTNGAGGLELWPLADAGVPRPFFEFFKYVRVIIEGEWTCLKL
jgi:hypothetical protein